MTLTLVSQQLTEVSVWQCMQVQPQLELLSKDGCSVDQVPSHSLARVDYANAAEGAVNEQVCKT